MAVFGTLESRVSTLHLHIVCIQFYNYVSPATVFILMRNCRFKMLHCTTLKKLYYVVVYYYYEKVEDFKTLSIHPNKKLPQLFGCMFKPSSMSEH